MFYLIFSQDAHVGQETNSSQPVARTAEAAVQRAPSTSAEPAQLSPESLNSMHIEVTVIGAGATNYLPCFLSIYLS